MSDARTKARLRLWLRAERAMGLRTLPVGPVVPAEPQPRIEMPPQQPAMASNPAVEPAKHHYGTPASMKANPDPQQMPPLPGIGWRSDAVEPPDELFTAPELPLDQKKIALEVMNANEVTGCTRCRLSESRTQTVFGEGNPDAALFFIGEGPGENEDRTGRPFVGRAGELLNKMIAGMGLKREEVFIANIVKCRPPGNRAPVPDEIAACTPYLERQLEIVRPKVIVTLGLPATQYMLKTKMPMRKLRGQWHTWRGIKLMPTFHPAYILRFYTPEVRGTVWGDLQQVMAELGLSPRR